MLFAGCLLSHAVVDCEHGLLIVSLFCLSGKFVLFVFDWSFIQCRLMLASV